MVGLAEAGCGAEGDDGRGRVRAENGRSVRRRHGRAEGTRTREGRSPLVLFRRVDRDRDSLLRLGQVGHLDVDVNPRKRHDVEAGIQQRDVAVADTHAAEGHGERRQKVVLGDNFLDAFLCQ